MVDPALDIVIQVVHHRNASTVHSHEAASEHISAICDHQGDPCDDCVSEFLIHHYEKSHESKRGHRNPNFACSFCAAVFTTKFDAAEHVITTHIRDPKHNCETCYMEFSSQEKADQHMDMIRHWRSKFGCQTCGRIFSSQALADQHMVLQGAFEAQGFVRGLRRDVR